MLFTHDTEMALQTMTALVNTAGGPAAPDQLATTEDLDGFVARWRWTGPRDRDAAELAAVRALRPRLRRLWDLPELELVAQVNQLLAETRALPQLVNHDEWGWHLHATPDDAPLATRMLVEAAMATVDVIRAGELGRLQVCQAPDCEDVLVDLSRNRSRRFCSTTCGNRVAAAAYRERQAAATEHDGG